MLCLTKDAFLVSWVFEAQKFRKLPCFAVIAVKFCWFYSKLYFAGIPILNMESLLGDIFVLDVPIASQRSSETSIIADASLWLVLAITKLSLYYFCRERGDGVCLTTKAIGPARTFARPFAYDVRMLRIGRASPRFRSFRKSTTAISGGVYLCASLPIPPFVPISFNCLTQKWSDRGCGPTPIGQVIMQFAN